MAQNASTGVINFKIFARGGGGGGEGGGPSTPPHPNESGACPLVLSPLTLAPAFGARQTRLPNVKIVPTPLVGEVNSYSKIIKKLQQKVVLMHYGSNK